MVEVRQEERIDYWLEGLHTLKTLARLQVKAKGLTATPLLMNT
jgi:hypothetical protein